MATMSVVVPSYRRLHRLPHMAQSWLDQGCDELVLVLDGPHPGWQEALAVHREDPRVLVVELEENRGLALARIAGLRSARGELVLLADDDVVPRPGLLAHHRRAHRAAEVVVVGSMPVALPRRRPRDAAPTYLYAREYAHQAKVWRQAPETVVSSLWGGNVSLPRALYEAAEESRPSIALPYNEDLDLGWRLRDLGARAAFVPAAAADHHHRRGIRAFARECEARGRAAAMLQERWGRRPPQLEPLLTIPAGYHPALARVQRHLAAQEGPDVVERALVLASDVAGVLGLWSLQDALARVLRRGLMMRGYRLATS